MTKILFILCLFISYCFGQNGNPSLGIHVIKNKLPESLLLSFSLTSPKDRDLKVPRQDKLIIGYSDDSTADCYFEVLEISGQSEKKVTPTADYQYLPTKTKNLIVLLKKGRS
jgi:hypothetical protein